MKSLLELSFQAIKEYVFHILVLVLLSIFSVAQNQFSNDCGDPDFGRWDFGLVPTGCNAADYGDLEQIKKNYAPLIYDATKGDKNTYMRNMVQFISGLSETYLLSRKPEVSQREKEAFERAVLAMAHQESLFSHYRIGDDGQIKFVLGDRQNAFGMMQIDRRWHAVAKANGDAVDLTQHTLYALDLFYKHWERAPTKECVSGYDDWKNRARSAWAAYNGGPRRYCRFTYSDDRWSMNDLSFHTRYQQQEWKRFMDESAPTLDFDYACLVAGNTTCGLVEPLKAPEEVPTSIDASRLSGKKVQLASGPVCIYKNEKLQCVENERDGLCLKYFASFDEGKTVLLTEAEEKLVEVFVWDRHTLCEQVIKGLVKVGHYIKLNKTINLRYEPNDNRGAIQLGQRVRDQKGRFVQARIGHVYQVLGFTSYGLNRQTRFYKVKVGESEGYIYGGSLSQSKWRWDKWAKRAERETGTEIIIPVVDSVIAVKPENGVILKESPHSEEVMTQVPRGEVTAVLDTVVVGDSSEVYHRVRYGGEEGYIYGGRLTPHSTTSSWVDLVSP